MVTPLVLRNVISNKFVTNVVVVFAAPASAAAAAPAAAFAADVAIQCSL